MLIFSKQSEFSSFWKLHFLFRFNDLFIYFLFSYALDINVDRVEDVLLHQKLLTLAKDPDNQPVFHVRFMEVLLFI